MQSEKPRYTWAEEDLGRGENNLIRFMYGIHGSFFTSFWEAVVRADPMNLSRLMRAFPDEIVAYRMMMDAELGQLYWYDLLKRAKIHANGFPVPVDRPGPWTIYITPPEKGDFHVDIVKRLCLNSSGSPEGDCQDGGEGSTKEGDGSQVDE